MNNFVRHFDEISKNDFQLTGGKAANLGELSKAGFKVPPGFCVSSRALDHFIEQNGLGREIAEIAGAFDYDNFVDVDEKTAAIRAMIESAPLPDDLLAEIKLALKKLMNGGRAFVAVRSSVAVKNSDVSSFPGMMDTYHYLNDEEDVIRHIKMCFASLWTSRAVHARHHKGVPHENGLIAPIVQKMVFSEVAGILFTANPISGSRDELVIESNWGLGESVVSGKSMNDFFILNKADLKIKNKKISKKTVMCTFDQESGCGRKECRVGQSLMNECTLRDEQLNELGRRGLQIEKVFGFPQDIEWSYEKGELFILQSRNIRTLNQVKGEKNGPKNS
ncbi:MAG: PEP/pyruvate-binding domain-containing protein [Pseudomonadota bacterium]